MTARLLHPDEYELDTRSSADSQGSFNLDEADFESQVPPRPRRVLRQIPLLARLFLSTNFAYRPLKPSRRFLWGSTRLAYPRLRFRRCFLRLHAVAGIICALVILTAIFRPSYTRLPPHYSSLRDAVSQSTEPGRGNPRNEKVFIAASLYDRNGDLAQGHWGASVLRLIDLLGKDNVFLSVYENDSGTEGERALRGLEEQITCEKSIVFEEHLDLATLPKVIVPDGSRRTKRIEYLAEVRNRALRPLNNQHEVQYDRLLYLNDVAFDPIDALHLLFSTNVAEDGSAHYRAVCAIDFINPFKFYDTYATRDLQGYSMGLPFFPWFSTAGESQSREDVLSGKDAVRVRSCWSGMVAFDARFFQGSPGNQKYKGVETPVQFRASHELFWEASECCLIHADIQDPFATGEDSGIYLNPFVRVAYDPRTLSWLGTTRRFEKIYSFIQNLGSRFVGLPWFNPRRDEVPGQIVKQTVWVPNGEAGSGSFQAFDRVAGKDGFCGRPGLQFSNRVTGVIYGVLDSLMDRASLASLEESRHAPKSAKWKAVRTSGARPRPKAALVASVNSTNASSFTPASPFTSPSSILDSANPPSSSSSSLITQQVCPEQGENRSEAMYPVADVDDTAGFMAAARAWKPERDYFSASSSQSADACNDDGSHEDKTGDAFRTNAAAVYDAFCIPGEDAFDGFAPPQSDAGNFEAESEIQQSVTEWDGTDNTVKQEQQPITVATASRSLPATHASEEDRENLTTFKSWGPPAPRDKPAARIRRIIIKGLPAAWCSPAKVLSFVHGGTIDSINVTPSGTAHILFCDADACRAFYDKYPNGIDLDRDRKITVLVEMGQEVDIIPSGLSFSLSVGATRVVRAVGAQLDVSMEQLVKLATSKNGKLEKIIDTYTPGEARSIIFRFCSVDDAVRFRASFVRKVDFEQCNVQYAADPCETATGYHVD
ncbi:uncharacterized protein BP01DRAFT_414087 [Aspergillus saccharolyticus JOP 1030-1]|uniref:Cryptococcal mannosyltransferase 1-domain-containing protein n=1 Tax=Aspergillus saccharolyticus JOP 1030-1 TaxID=1450539 RepID=A0A319A735_9EURO|nr:hypothetical protein BP01DRAFT_414087 [Aspergillus saccharolyticus JOP 1030-1]PYH47768.1 hypothetical protein BP01DRAFT_414087 [Aspergillus saccharolyticus JOP 1030-1]